MKKEKSVLFSAKEVFDSLWDDLNGELTTRSINLSLITDDWAIPNESGIEGIVFTKYFLWNNFCFLGGKGFFSGRGDKPCGEAVFVIPSKGRYVDEIERDLCAKITRKGRSFLGEAFEIIKLDPENKTINLFFMKKREINRFLAKKDGKTFYKKGIVKFLYDRMVEKIFPRKKIVTNPNGVIYKLAQERLADTTFPAGVKNPLPLDNNRDEDIPDGRD